MKIVVRLVTACLLACLALPQLAQAGGDAGKEPYEIGEKYFLRKDYRTALKFYRRALERNDARAHYRMGLIFEDAGRDRDARRQFERFVQLGPADPQRSDSIQRLNAIEERLKNEAARSPGLLERGKRLFAEGKYRDAEKALLQAASKDASNPEVHFSLGEVYMKLEAYGKAEAEFKKAKGSY